jgi:2-deoxy-D-gluconate 3-dehydrogenase
MKDLEDSICLVTGASGGLGVVIAEALGEAGGNLILLARRAEKLREVEYGLGLNGIKKVEIMVCDVTQEDQVSYAFDSIFKKHGRIDILVNNAGTTVASPTTQMKIADWKNVIDTNLTSVFVCSKHAAKHMIPKRRGKIINLASVLGLQADTSLELPYYASKSGIIGLTRQLALEFAPHNINVNAIAPGFFPSEMTRQFVEDIDALSYLLARIPLRRIGKPEDLKGVVRFLVSHASDYITGQTIVVDGGWTLW